MTVIWLKLCFLYLCVTNVLSRGIVFHYNNTYKYDVPYEVTVNKYTEYIMEFAGDLEVYNTPARVTVASDFANTSYPVFITARQQRGVFAWQLPMVVQTAAYVSVKFTNISRTLCPHNNPYGEDEDACDVPNSNTPIVHLTSASPDDVPVTILVETVKDFFIKLNSTTNLMVTPSQPKYYFFPFDQRPNLDLDLQGQSLKHKSRCNEKLGVDEQFRLDRYLKRTTVLDDSWLSRPKSVIVLIESDDDICAVVSIQSFSCPVFDNERDILYDGYYLTMTRRGGITLTQDAFPVGFYIVFIVKSDDDDCVSSPGNATAKALYDDRVKSFSFRIISTISYQDYLIAAGAVLAFFLSFYVGFIMVILCQRRRLNTVIEVSADVHGEEGYNNEDRVNINSTVRRRCADSVQSTSAAAYIEDGDNVRDSSSSDTESIASIVEEPNADTDLLYVAGARLCLADLARCRPRVLQARSKMYLWNVLTVAVFYTLPVIQLVVTYQRLLNQSGNQDLCYFNFLCAHPLVVLSDFNHVYSNLGYVLLGTLFLLAVWRRHVRYKACSPAKKELGIPQHFGLLYAMGVALVSEGVLSAAYHVCPNSMNFQFDTSFMYVTSVLCMVKIYQCRHPDINARAHATFGILALIIFIGLVGVLNANFYFWVIFTVVHIVMCLFMTFQIYYLGRFRLEWRVLSSAWELLWSRPVAAVTPARAGRCLLLLIANLANWALAALGIAQHSKDFASHLLLILMSNLFLYTLFYIVMKLLHRESIRWYSWVYIALTYTIWFSSSYFYLDQSTNWALTPAQSRQSNRVCSLLQLYDSHDIWHFMSSVAMFISFNMYLTIDDNLSNVPRDEIMVF